MRKSSDRIADMIVNTCETEGYDLDELVHKACAFFFNKPNLQLQHERTEMPSDVLVPTLTAVDASGQTTQVAYRSLFPTMTDLVDL